MFFQLAPALAFGIRRGRSPVAAFGPALLLGGWLLALPHGAAALEPGKRFEHYAHEGWPSVAHASTVHTIFPSPTGFLWIGTSEGLVRFDGEHMATFDSHRLPEGIDHDVRALFETRDGGLWAGSFSRGLYRLRGTTVEPVAPGATPPGPHVLDFLERPDGSLWVAGKGGVAIVQKTEGPAPAFIDRSQGLPDRCTHALVQDAEGVLWAGTHRGLFRLGEGGWQIDTPNDPRPPAEPVDALWAEPAGPLWVGTRGDGLWRRDGAGWRRFGTADGLGSERISALLQDRAGTLWVTSHGGNLAWFDGQRFSPFALPATLCGDRILALAEDLEGGLWIGTELCGLHRLADRPFVTLSQTDGLPSGLVLGLGQDREGDVWIGTRGAGMALAAAGSARFAPLACSPQLPCDECWDFSPAAAGGSAFRTVCRTNVVLASDGENVRRAPLPVGLPGASFVLETSDGAVWYALDKKVVRVHRGVTTSLAGLERSEGYRILFEGKNGTLWASTDDALLAWHQGKTRTWRLPASERPAEVANFHEDDAGTLWMATKGEGIRRLGPDRTGITTVGMAQGLPTGFVVQILEDGQGRLWASSSKGIFWVKKQELAETALGRRRRVEASLYDANDGIYMWSQSFGHPAGFKDAAGKLWFATNGGVTIVDPPPWASAPRVRVDRIRLAGQTLELQAQEAPALTARRGDLEVAFAPLTLSRLDTVSFRYRLRALSTGATAPPVAEKSGDATLSAPAPNAWIDLGTSRTLFHPGIEPGRYQLLLEARSRESAFGGQAAAVTFTLRAPFFRSPSFALLLLFGAGLLFLGLHRARIARTRAGLGAVLAERTRIARDMHDTLAQAFVATSVQLECLEEALEGDAGDPGTRAKVQRHLDTARKVVGESLEEARAAVWVLRPQAIEPGLVPALETLVRRTSGSTPIDLQVSGVARDLPPLVASNLLRIAQEAVANAHRHARARRIGLHLSFSPRSVCLTVHDDGRGLVADGEQPANRRPGGLRGMQERAAQIGGRLAIDGSGARGTTITIEVAA